MTEGMERVLRNSGEGCEQGRTLGGWGLFKLNLSWGEGTGHEKMGCMWGLSSRSVSPEVVQAWVSEKPAWWESRERLGKSQRAKGGLGVLSCMRRSNPRLPRVTWQGGKGKIKVKRRCFFLRKEEVHSFHYVFLKRSVTWNRVKNHCLAVSCLKLEHIALYGISLL